jgi:competence protein ComEC
MAARVFWAIVAGFLLGVFARSICAFGFSCALLCVLLAVVVLALGWIEQGKRMGAIVIATFFIAAALGIVRMNRAVLSGDPVLTAHLNKQITIEGMVMAEPDTRDNSVRVMIGANKLIAPSRASVHAGVLAVLPAHADVHYGEVVRAWGKLEAPAPFDTGSGRAFAYPQYLAAQGITYELALANAEQVQGSSFVGNPLQAAAIWTKETFEGGITATLPEPEAGLAAGITVGNKRSIGSDLSAVFQSVGLVHVVVLSGYNITVVLNAAAQLLTWAPRYVQFGSSTFIVALFILMAGGAGSATRAGIMALVAVAARATRRTFLASRALALAALLIVLWNPFELVFDPSFQLSALATLGLIVFTPVFNQYSTWIPEKFALREIVSSTIATQLAVLPLLLYQNGQLPIYTLPANLLALVAVPLAMLFACIAALFGIAFGSFAVPIAFPAYVLLGYIIAVARFFAALPYASVSIGAFSVGWMFVAYGAMFFAAWYVRPSTANA